MKKGGEGDTAIPVSTTDRSLPATHFLSPVTCATQRLYLVRPSNPGSPQSSRGGHLPEYRPFDLWAYRMSLLLVPSYFAELNRFCIPSPIVPVPPPGYTSTSLQEAFP